MYRVFAIMFYWKNGFNLFMALFNGDKLKRTEKAPDKAENKNTNINININVNINISK